MTDPRGFSIKLFLADGMPDGLRLVEKSNWTGKGVVCPRSRFPEVKERDEFGKTGVYILSEPPAGERLPTVYIGEGDPVRPRLESHNADKDFWTSLIVFTSKDENLNKAHVQYLEARLIRLAKEAKRCVLDNVNTPQLPTLAEPDIADMETFLDQMLLIFPVLGISVFEKPPETPLGRRVLYLEAKGVRARGFESPQGFVVLSDSEAVKEEVPSFHAYLISLRQNLLEQGVMVEDSEHYRLAQDYTFDSPSMAAGVLLGRNSNGRIEWKDENGATLKEIQTEASQKTTVADE